MFRLSRSVYYKKFDLFFVNVDTLNCVSTKGGDTSNVQPLYIDRYDLPLFEIIPFDVKGNNPINGYTGSDAEGAFGESNSVMNYIPVDSITIGTENG